MKCMSSTLNTYSLHLNIHDRCGVSVRLTWLFFEVSTHTHCTDTVAHALRHTLRGCDGDQRKPDCFLPPPHRYLYTHGNHLVCAPLTAQSNPAVTFVYGSVTCMSIPWTFDFGGCTFSGDYAGAPLVRSGFCPTEGGTLMLAGKGIKSVPADAFAGMSKME